MKYNLDLHPNRNSLYYNDIMEFINNTDLFTVDGVYFGLSFFRDFLVEIISEDLYEINNSLL